MKQIDSIVEVTAWFFKKGDHISFEWLESLICSKGKNRSWGRVTEHWENVTEEIKHEKYRFISKNKSDTRFLEDAIGFEFSIVSSGGYSSDDRYGPGSGLQSEIENAGHEETLSIEIEQLNKIAERKYEELINPPKPEQVKIGKLDLTLIAKEVKNPKSITFLTAWWYDCFESFNGESSEWEVDFGMLGEIDISSIKIIEEKENGKTKTTSNDEVRKASMSS